MRNSNTSILCSVWSIERKNKDTKYNLIQFNDIVAPVRVVIAANF